MPDHPKIVAAGPLASWLYICGICYCSRYLTDGFIPAGQVRRLADVEEPQQLAARLVEVGLWEVAPDGFQVHDYLTYNPSAEAVKRERARTAERQATFRHRNPGYNDRYRAASADARSDTSNASNGMRNGVTPVSRNGVSAPVPSPSPSPSPSTVVTTDSEDSGSPTSVADADASSDDVDAPTGAEMTSLHATPPDAPTGTPPDAPRPERAERVTFTADAPAMRLAVQLREAILAHNSTAIDARKAMTGQGIQAWARKFDQFIADRRRAPPDVEAVIGYAVSQDFWRPIILNPDKLKKHFDTINGQRLNALKREAASSAAGGVDNDRHTAGHAAGQTAGQTAGHAAHGRRAGADAASSGKPALGSPEYYAAYERRVANR